MCTCRYKQRATSTLLDALAEFTEFHFRFSMVSGLRLMKRKHDVDKATNVLCTFSCAVPNNLTTVHDETHIISTSSSYSEQHYHRGINASAKSSRIRLLKPSEGCIMSVSACASPPGIPVEKWTYGPLTCDHCQDQKGPEYSTGLQPTKRSTPRKSALQECELSTLDKQSSYKLPN